MAKSLIGVAVVAVASATAIMLSRGKTQDETPKGPANAKEAQQPWLDSGSSRLFAAFVDIWIKVDSTIPGSLARNLKRLCQAGDLLHSMTAAPGLEPLRQPLDGARVGETGGAHLDGGGACQ